MLDDEPTSRPTGLLELDSFNKPRPTGLREPDDGPRRPTGLLEPDIKSTQASVQRASTEIDRNNSAIAKGIFRSVTSLYEKPETTKTQFAFKSPRFY